MPRLVTLTNLTRTITVPILGDVMVRVTYRIGLLAQHQRTITERQQHYTTALAEINHLRTLQTTERTDERDADITARLAALVAPMSIEESLSCLIESWDITTEDGSMLPLDPATLHESGLRDILIVIERAIYADGRPGKGIGGSSVTTS